MAKPVTKTLEVAASVAAGAGVDTTYMYEHSKWVTVTGTFVATLQLQVSNDGTTWATVGSNITAPGVTEVTARCKYLRVNTSAYTSGTPAASVYGLETIK